MIDIDSIYETYIENFFEQCSKDYELDCLVWEHFSDAMNFYRHCKDDFWDESPYNTSFDILYKWDAESFISDPKKCFLAYLNSKNNS